MAHGKGIVARSAALGEPHCRLRRGRNGIVTGKHNGRRFRLFFFWSFFFQLFEDGKIVRQHFQSGAQGILEFLNIAAIFRIFFCFCRHAVGEGDKQSLGFGAGRTDFFNLADGLA